MTAYVSKHALLHSAIRLLTSGKLQNYCAFTRIQSLHGNYVDESMASIYTLLTVRRLCRLDALSGFELLNSSTENEIQSQ